MRRTHSLNGTPYYPGLAGLAGVGYAAGFYAFRMNRTQRLLLASGLAAQVATSWLASPQPRQASAFLSNLTWSAAAIFGSTRLAAALDRSSTRVADELSGETHQYISWQRARGWENQQRSAKALFDLAASDLERTRPVTKKDHAKVTNAKARLAELASELRGMERPSPSAAPPTERLEKEGS
jgi:hypothetical protein